jgi:chromosome segregation ATPase
MPTNKLWLEHTERAAWDSVEALRQKLAAAEDRIARLAPLNESWQAILGALDEARAKHGIEKESYAEIAAALVVRLAELEQRLSGLESELEHRRRAEDVASAAALSRGNDFGSRELDDPRDRSDPARRFARLLAKRKRLSPAARRSADGLLRMVESLLEDFEELPLSEAGDLAVELGLVAMRLELLSRRERTRPRTSRFGESPHQGARDDDEDDD